MFYIDTAKDCGSSCHRFDPGMSPQQIRAIHAVIHSLPCFAIGGLFRKKRMLLRSALGLNQLPIPLGDCVFQSVQPVNLPPLPFAAPV